MAKDQIRDAQVGAFAQHIGDAQTQNAHDEIEQQRQHHPAEQHV